MITWLTHQTNDNIPVYWKSSSIARSEISAMRWSNPVAFQVTKRNETLQVGKNTSGSLNGIVMRPTRLFWYSICHQNLPFKTRVVLKHPQVFRFGRKFEFEWNTLKGSVPSSTFTFSYSHTTKKHKKYNLQDKRHQIATNSETDLSVWFMVQILQLDNWEAFFIFIYLFFFWNASLWLFGATVYFWSFHKDWIRAERNHIHVVSSCNNLCLIDSAYHKLYRTSCRLL